MKAYENLRSNRHEISALRRNIEHYKAQISGNNQQMQSTNAQLVPLNAQKQQILNQISSNVFIDEGRIKTALSDFIAGWISIMAALQQSLEQQEHAQKIYSDTVSQLFN